MTTAATNKSGLMQHSELLAKVGYFGTGFGVVAPGAFIPLLLRSEGVSSSWIGALLMSSTIFQTLLVPQLAFLADKFQIPGRIQAVGALVSSVALWVAALIALPRWLVAALCVIYYAGNAGCNPLYDQHVIRMLGPEGKPRWGMFRCIMSCSYGLGSIVGAPLSASLGWCAIAAQYTFGYVLQTSCMFVTKAPPSNVPQKVELSAVLKTILHSRRLLLYTVVCCFEGMCIIFILGFLNVFIEELGAPESLIGLNGASMVLTEIVVFMCSKAILARWTLDRLMMGALGTMCIRLLGYAVMGSPWWILPLNLLHGSSFACMWLAAVDLFTSEFPPELANSAFGILTASASGVGPLVGSLVTGILYDRLGGRIVFAIWGVVILVVFVAFVTLTRQTHDVETTTKLAADLPSPAKRVLLCEAPRHEEDPLPLEPTTCKIMDPLAPEKIVPTIVCD
jgi:PPP family 3-phenylpropionic acid transporter